jgi:ribosomal protein S18 acetylase RimI-like enzyme
MPFRPWREEDVPEIVALCNAHDSAIDPDFEDSSEQEIRDELAGLYDAVFAEVFEEGGKIMDVVAAQVDKSRKRIEIDVFGLPESHDYGRSLTHAIRWAKANHPGFELRGSCNQNDEELIAANQSAGMKVVRKYWTMRNPAPSGVFPRLPWGVKVEQAHFEHDRRLWHRLLMESFEGHYGFKQKEFDEWDRLQRKLSLQDSTGVFFLWVRGKPAGLLVCTDHRSENKGGFIDKLGVLPEFRGKGFGELLLRWGCAYSVARGFKDVALGVDTGNATGAVKLYEKAGFQPANVWLAFSDSEA